MTRPHALRSRIGDLWRTGRLLIATDFDGTLTPIVARPEVAVLPQPTVDLLRALITTPGCTLMIVSGRSLADLGSRVPPGAILAGNHGFEIEGPGLSFRHEEAAALRSRLQEVCGTVAAVLSRWSGAFLEDKGFTATAHYRGVPEAHQQEVVLAVRRSMGQYGTTFGLRAGKKSLEIHPRVGWDKGAAVNWVREQLAMDLAGCVCIGDDRTDEAMFRDCAGATTIAVGVAPRTRAEFLLRDPDEVQAFLADLIGYRAHSDADVPTAETALNPALP